MAVTAQTPGPTANVVRPIHKRGQINHVTTRGQVSGSNVFTKAAAATTVNRNLLSIY